jgi:hypothetical protein
VPDLSWQDHPRLLQGLQESETRDQPVGGIGPIWEWLQTAVAKERHAMKKPVSSTVEWQDPVEDITQASSMKGEQITRSGTHHVKHWIDENHEIQEDRRARYLRNYGGRERDPRKIPPPEAQLSGRTSKSASRVRFPSRAFRENLAKIDWEQ